MLYSTQNKINSESDLNELATALFGGASANWKRNPRIDILTERKELSKKYIGLLETFNSDPAEIMSFFEYARTGDEAKKAGKFEEFMHLKFPQQSLLLTGDTGSCKSSFLNLMYQLLRIRLRQLNRLRDYAIKTNRIYWKKKISVLISEHSVFMFKETDLRTIVSKAVKWPNRENESAFLNLIDRIGEVKYTLIDEALYASNWKFPENLASEYEAYFKIYADTVSDEKNKGKIFIASSNNVSSDLSASVPIIRRMTEIFDRTIIMNRIPGL